MSGPEDAGTPYQWEHCVYDTGANRWDCPPTLQDILVPILLSLIMIIVTWTIIYLLIRYFKRKKTTDKILVKYGGRFETLKEKGFIITDEQFSDLKIAYGEKKHAENEKNE